VRAFVSPAAGAKSIKVRPVPVGNDGVNWVNVGTAGSANAGGIDPALQIVSSVCAAFIRYQFTLNSTGSSTVAACFDLRVNVDKA